LEPLQQQAVDQVEAVLKDLVESGQGIESARKPLKEIALANGWDWFVGKTAADLGRNLGPLVRAYSYASYSDDRRQQLLDEEQGAWIFHAGMACDEHPQLLDGLCLEPGHPFWSRHSPPHGWDCDCYVTGVSSIAMTKRLGSDPERSVPEWCSQIDPATGNPIGLSGPWADGPPSVRALLEALAAGQGPD